MKQEATIKEECPFKLEANAEICPLAIPTYLRAEASVEDLKSFFTTFVERDLWHLTFVAPGNIVKLLDDPTFPSRTFDEKCNAVTDVFVDGLMAKRAEVLSGWQ